MIAVMKTPLVTKPGFSNRPAIVIIGTIATTLIFIIVITHSNLNIKVTADFFLISPSSKAFAN